MTRHHAEPNINMLLTRNLPFDSDFRQVILEWYNWTTERMVNLNVTWLGYVFVLISFVHMHGVVAVP